MKRHREKVAFTSQGERPHTEFSPTALKRNQPYQDIDFLLLAFRTVRQSISVFKPLNLWYFITAAQANQYTYV